MGEPSALGRFPVTVETPVAWGEMDAFGHVNNAMFFRYFESARIAYFDRLEPLKSLGSRDIRPILARATCDFRRPLHYPDRLKIEGTVSKLGTTSFTMLYRILSEREQGIAAEGEGIIVLLDYKKGEKVALPAELRAAIEALEASG